jgi:hypothetical protein
MGDVHQESACVRIGSIVIRCYEFERMLQFWRAALHYVVGHADEGFVILKDPSGRGQTSRSTKPRSSALVGKVGCTLICIRRISWAKWNDWSILERHAIRGGTSLTPTTWYSKTRTGTSSVWFKRSGMGSLKGSSRRRR